MRFILTKLFTTLHCQRTTIRDRLKFNKAALMIAKLGVKKVVK